MKGARPEPTGIGHALTSVHPLYRAAWEALSKAPLPWNNYLEVFPRSFLRAIYPFLVGGKPTEVLLLRKRINDVCDTLLYLYDGLVPLLRFPHSLSKLFLARCPSRHSMKCALTKRIITQSVSICLLQTPEFFSRSSAPSRDDQSGSSSMVNPRLFMRSFEHCTTEIILSCRKETEPKPAVANERRGVDYALANADAIFTAA